MFYIVALRRERCFHPSGLALTSMLFWSKRLDMTTEAWVYKQSEHVLRLLPFLVLTISQYWRHIIWLYLVYAESPCRPCKGCGVDTKVKVELCWRWHFGESFVTAKSYIIRWHVKCWQNGEKADQMKNHQCINDLKFDSMAGAGYPSEQELRRVFVKVQVL